MSDEVPEQWQHVRLGEVVKPGYGKALDKSLRKDVGRYPVVGSAGLMAYTDSALAEGEVLVVGRKGNVGEVQVFRDGVWPIDTAYFLRPPQSVDIGYFYHFLVAQEMKKLDSSTTTPSLRREDLEAVNLRIPCLEEQREIVRILEEQFSRLDAAAASIAAVRRKAARLRASFFKAALSGALSPPDEADAWELTSIGEIAEFGRKPPKDLLEANSEVSFVPMACVEEESGRIQLDQTIGAAEGKRRSLTYFEEGDVLFAKITPCMENGKVAIAKGLRNGAAFGSSEFYVLQPLASRVRPEFLNYVLVDPNFRGIAARAMTGAVGQQRVPRKFVEDFQILIPPLGSQDAIIAMLKSQFSRIESALLASEAIQEKLLATRRSLLHAAFSGELTKEWRDKNNG